MSSHTKLLDDIKKATEANDASDLQRLLSLHEMELQPALEIALRSRNIEAADALLNHGCRMLSNAVSAAHDSCTAKTGFDVASFECMLAHGWNINHSTGHLGDALIMAISYGKPTLAEWLLAHGADPTCNESGHTFGHALERACFGEDVPLHIIKLLIEHGADVKGPESGAMLQAAWSGRADAIEVLLDVGSADIDAIPLTIDHDLDCSFEFWDEWGTALHGAAAKGHVDCVKFLLARGANVDIRNRAGRTARETAEHFGHAECVLALAGKGEN